MKQTYVKYLMVATFAGGFLFTSCRTARETTAQYEVTKVEGSMITIDSVWDTIPNAKAAEILKPYKDRSSAASDVYKRQTVGDVFEILPFENSLCVLTMKGTDLRRLFEAIASLHGEGVSGIRLEITKNGKLLNAFVGEKPLKDDQLYTVATIDYLADGNGRMDAFLQAEKRVCPEDATLRGLFLDYVRKQTAEGKAITSKLDGRITIK